MSDDFLSRWSRRKIAARSGRPPPAAPSPVEPAPGPPAAEAQALRAEPVPLPPVESLTPDSDFTPFMQAEVDPATRRQALKTLFQDPQFNVMDGLDVYIDDYSKPDPLPEGWLAKMNQVGRLGEYIEPLEADAARPQNGLPDPAGEPAPVHPRDAPDVQPLEAEKRPDSPSESDEPLTRKA
jgi:hypothetical protein